MNAHRKLKTTLLVASAPLLAPVAAHASNGSSSAHGGWGWWDAAIWGGALLGIIVFGLFGDLVVGALIVGIATIVGGSVTLAKSTGRATRTRLEIRRETRRAVAMHSVPSADGQRQPG